MYSLWTNSPKTDWIERREPLESNWRDPLPQDLNHKDHFELLMDADALLLRENSRHVHVYGTCKN
jgi:hypothetical protein